jgi:adenine-specific DNA-methyltransferase
VAELVWQKRKGGGNDTMFIGVDHEYILVYAKSMASQPAAWRVKYDEEYLKRYSQEDENGKYYYDTLSRPGLKSPIIYDVICPDGSVIKNGTWQISEKSFHKGLETGEVSFIESKNGGYTVVRKVRQPEGRVFRSILTSVSNKNAADDMEAIFSIKKIFSSPKPQRLLSELLELCTGGNDIVLDFFSGSATTAHAVMQLNAEDGGKRKFIMVQLPKVCTEGSEAAKAGYSNICEIGKERIRRAGDKIKDEAGLTAQNLDIGFRVLKLDDTNMNDVYYAAGETTQDMISLMESNIKPGRSDMDLLFGCLLDWGLPLSMPHTHEDIDGFTVHTYNGGDLIACFEDCISEKTVREIASRKPLRAVFRDSSFTSSPEKINVFEIFKLLAPNTTVRVI